MISIIMQIVSFVATIFGYMILLRYISKKHKRIQELKDLNLLLVKELCKRDGIDYAKLMATVSNNADCKVYSLEEYVKRKQ